MSEENTKSMPVENAGKPNQQTSQKKELPNDDLDKVTGGISTGIVDPDCPPETRAL
jgi:hypothetical protein